MKKRITTCFTAKRDSFDMIASSKEFTAYYVRGTRFLHQITKACEKDFDAAFISSLIRLPAYWPGYLNHISAGLTHGRTDGDTCGKIRATNARHKLRVAAAQSCILLSDRHKCRKKSHYKC